MTSTRMTVDQWVELFRFVGLNDQTMRVWHAEFERRHPDAHQSFLEWLALPAARMDQIRRDAAAGS